MRIEGRLQKSSNYWAAEVPLLFIYTQGKTKKEAYLMVKDAIEELVEKDDFSADIAPGDDNRFSVGSNNETLLMAFALKQQRSQRLLSIRDVALRLGSNTPSAYSRYENGKVKPSLDKFSQLLRAIDESLEPIIKIG